MARQRLTMQAIRFLIETYDDESTNHTFGDIVKMINEKFGIAVSREAVRKSYHKHKEELKNTPTPAEISTLQSAIRQRQNTQMTTSEEEVISIKKNLTKPSRKEFDTSIADDLSKDDLENLFKGS